MVEKSHVKNGFFFLAFTGTSLFNYSMIYHKPFCIISLSMEFFVYFHAKLWIIKVKDPSLDIYKQGGKGFRSTGMSSKAIRDTNSALRRSPIEVLM